jgi:hypothetical protein
MAVDAGWRVLHVLPGEPNVTTNQLAEVIFQGSGPTLAVFDYLDQMQGIDFVALRHRLMPQAAGRGIRLALLANARPRFLRTPNAERDTVFEHVEIVSDQALRLRVAQSIRRQLAPQATSQLGENRVAELCGERPIISMFIALELERRANNKSLTAQDVVGMRTGELVAWLRKRLAEDRLIPSASNSFLPSIPESPLIAAAAALAAAPISEPEIGRVSQSALAQVSAASASSVINALLSLGWLERRSAELVAAHDVVADEVLENVLIERPADAISIAVLHQVLDSCLDSPRAFGRFALTLQRILGPTQSSETFKRNLHDSASRWLADRASRLGEILATGDPDLSAYALGAAFAGPPWAGSCVGCWDALVEPWLTHHGTTHDARHILYRGLKFLPQGKSEVLASISFNWLAKHSRSIDAGFVLAPLLGRTDLGERAPDAIAKAFDWLDGHGKAIEAQFVFNPML